MALQEEEQPLQNPMSVLECLFCEEDRFEDEDLGKYGFDDEIENFDEPLKKPLSLLEHDLFWEDDELVSMLSKEKQTHFYRQDLNSDESLMVARKEAVDWILRVNAHYGFAAITAVLAVNYLDRFISSLCYQKDKPWMSQLTALACHSLAAKVEETQVPFLINFQVEESKYLFDSKSIQRMELLVLSTLQWKMNPVTPFSFFVHIVRRLGLKRHLHWEFLRRCDRLLLSVITDSRFLCYLPSVIAASTVFLLIKEIESCNALEYQNQLMGIFNISKEKIDECYKLILELLDSRGHILYQTHKRKYQSAPGSPNGVIDAYFSCDSSNDSWALASSVSSSPEPLFKKSRAQDQQMRLAPLNRVPFGMLSSRT